MINSMKAVAAMMLTVAMMFVAGCKPEDDPNNGGGNNGNNDTDVRVTTYTPQDITATTAKCGGDVIVTQGLSLTELGVCWSKEQNPTVEQAHLSTTVWNEPFVCTITDLEPETKYYVRAYALRGLVYYYAEEVSITTAGADLPIVTTMEVSNITTSSATGGGDVVSEGGCPVTDRGICWSINPNPTIEAAYISLGTGVGPFEIVLESLGANTTYYVRAYAENCNGLCYGEEVSFTTPPNSYDGHNYVDLGLPSGTLWATCNVGANKPEEYGDYFAWGETLPKDRYTWDTYKYCMGNNYSFTKYCFDPDFGYDGFTDTLTVLLPEDDAATVNWGEGWCMPTYNQLRELKDNTTSVWTTLNGVNGYLFTATNGGSIFLPAAGHGSMGNGGFIGYYWSNSLSYQTHSPEGAGELYFLWDNCSFANGVSRSWGNSVRPVRSSSKK